MDLDVFLSGLAKSSKEVIRHNTCQDSQSTLQAALVIEAENAAINTSATTQTTHKEATHQVNAMDREAALEKALKKLSNRLDNIDSCL